jgi:NADPH-dependent 2,4-dienoyl-CoA reductase/sulfur reductase-like enzyme
MMRFDVVVIGAGPAGMSAALSAAKAGSCRVLIIERNNSVGGILNQCIHEGFGLIRFNESLTGPEYANRYERLLKRANVQILLNAMVTQVTPTREVICVTRKGVLHIQAQSIVLSTGCRERTRGMLAIPGTRPPGIYTAGVVQRLINVQNIKPGSNAVVLGSGDIGMIMARRMTLEGIRVISVLEKMSQCSGLLRNKALCLDDFGIPLKLCQTIIEIKGVKRLKAVIAACLDENDEVINGSEYEIECDTLVLSVGLIPENELAVVCGIDIDSQTGGPVVNERLESSISGIFCCGNSLHVHPLADYASEEGTVAGENAMKYALKLC